MPYMVVIRERGADEAMVEAGDLKFCFNYGPHQDNKWARLVTYIARQRCGSVAYFRARSVATAIASLFNKAGYLTVEVRRVKPSGFNRDSYKGINPKSVALKV